MSFERGDLVTFMMFMRVFKARVLRYDHAGDCLIVRAMDGMTYPVSPLQLSKVLPKR